MIDEPTLPKISVIVAAWNAGSILPQLINSYSEQSLKPKELIVIDGGSKDGTKEYLAGVPFVDIWLSEKDNGIFDAWNKGIDRASGEWVIFMGADDTFANVDSLRDAAMRLARIPEHCYIAYGRIELVDTGGRVRSTAGGPWNPKRFRHVGMSIPHQATFHRRRLFEDYGHFSMADRATETYEMLLRYLRDHDAVYLGDLLVARMGLGGVSSNPKNELRFYRAYISAQRRHGVFRLGPRLTAKLAFAGLNYALFSLLPERIAKKLSDGVRVLLGKPSLFC